MAYIISLVLISSVIFLIIEYRNRNKLQTLKRQLELNWGKPKIQKYYCFNRIGKYFINNKHREKAYHIISDNEVADLDLDDLFLFVDRTNSRIGQQYLYYKLRTVFDQNRLLKFDSLSKLFTHSKDLRIKCQLQLSKLNSAEAYDLESLINEDHPRKPSLWLAYIMAAASIIAIVLSFFKPIIIISIIPIMIYNWITHYKNKLVVDMYVNGVVQLRKSMKVAQVLFSYKEIQRFYGRVDFFEKVNSFSKKIKFIGFEKDASNEFSGVGWTIMELIKIVFNLEYIVFHSFIHSVNKERDSIDQLFCFIGEVDAAISVASVKAGTPKVCEPDFIEGNVFSIEKMVHPLIQNCTPNSVVLDGESMLLTGSNMSGKTTFIRMVAINSILAQTLHICFAKKYKAPFLKIYSSIRITDDLLDDTSYYLEEVSRVKTLIGASNADKPCLFILDEIFKGTNTIERISAGKAILSYLNKKNHFVFVSTHDIELTELLKEEGYNLYHFTEKVINEDLSFDYTLNSGALTTRNAIRILKLNKYPNEIIEEARVIENTYN